jgi:DNA/RNA-binding domain of Phe-tRNA-synthetase-like protein
MPDPRALSTLLDRAEVDSSVRQLRPDYRAMLIAADGLHVHAGDSSSEALLERAESAARDALRDVTVDQLPHVAAWRDAYRGFGAKPQRTRNSLEALLRRAVTGLPRVNRLTDVYNAVSVLHRIPIGGEDLDHYDGPPRLIRATGEEAFDTTADGHPAIEHPEVGEVVWTDGSGITCRRWNWRQGQRTRLRDSTSRALFILDALGPISDQALFAAADDLIGRLAELAPAMTWARRIIPEPASDPATVA